MQGWRQPQPSGTNRPSSYPSHPRGRSCMCLAGATQVDQGTRSVELAVRPPGHAEGTLERGRHSHRLETSAAHRSAAMAGGARPDPFRTRKLSRRAPMVLRGQPVGEQGAADRWTALDPHPAGSGAGAPRGDPLRGAPFFICLRSCTLLVYAASHFLHIEKPEGSIRALRGPFFMPASCLVCRLARTGRVPSRPRGSPALRPIRPACPPPALSGPCPFLRLSGPIPSGGLLARFSSCGGRGMRL